MLRPQSSASTALLPPPALRERGHRGLARRGVAIVHHEGSIGRAGVQVPGAVGVAYFGGSRQVNRRGELATEIMSMRFIDGLEEWRSYLRKIYRTDEVRGLEKAFDLIIFFSMIATISQLLQFLLWGRRDRAPSGSNLTLGTLVGASDSPQRFY